MLGEHPPEVPGEFFLVFFQLLWLPVRIKDSGSTLSTSGALLPVGFCQKSLGPSVTTIPVIAFWAHLSNPGVIPPLGILISVTTFAIEGSIRWSFWTSEKPHWRGWRTWTFWPCRVAYGILVPRPGIESAPPSVEVLTTSPSGKSQWWSTLTVSMLSFCCFCFLNFKLLGQAQSLQY